VGALAVDGQTLAVTEAAVAAEIHQALDVHLHLAAEVTFDLVVGVEHVADRLHIGVGQLVHAPVGGDASLVADVARGLGTDAEEIREREARCFRRGRSTPAIRAMTQ
jgi:hypothetical protein